MFVEKIGVTDLGEILTFRMEIGLFSVCLCLCVYVLMCWYATLHAIRVNYGISHLIGSLTINMRRKDAL